MRKYLVIALSALFVLGLIGSAFAFNGANQGSSRTSAMGLTNYQTEDSDNIWRNPAYVVKYKNKAAGRLGSYTALAPTAAPGANQRASAWGGVNLDVTVGTLGIWIGRTDDTTIDQMDSPVGGTAYAALPGGYQAGPTIGTLGTVSAPCPNKNLDVFYGLDLGAMLIGVRLNLDMDTSDVKDDYAVTKEPLAVAGFRATMTEDSVVTKARDLGLHVGIAMKDLPIAASVLIGMPSVSSTATVNDKLETDINANGVVDSTTTTAISDKLESDGAMNIGVYVNGSVKMSDTTTLVPTVIFEKTKNDSKRAMSYSEVITTADALAASTTTTASARSGKRGDTGTVFGLDAAFNMKPNDKTLVVTAVGLGYSTGETTMKNDIASDSTVVGAVTAYNNEPHGTQDDIKVETTSINVPFVLGIENKSIKDGKVIARLGVKGDLYKRSKTTTSDTDFYTDAALTPDLNKENTVLKTESVLSGTSAATVTMGLGIKFSDSVMLTAVLNQDVLFTGTYMLSGVPESLFTGLSVGYSF